MEPNHLLLFRYQSSLDIQSQPLYKSQHNQFLSICIVFKSPAVTRGFRPVAKGGFDRSFDINLNIKKGIMVYFIFAVFLFLVSLAILDSYPICHQ